MESIKEIKAKMAARLKELYLKSSGSQRMEIAIDQKIGMTTLVRYCSGHLTKLANLEKAESIAIAMETKLKPATVANADA